MSNSPPDKAHSTALSCNAAGTLPFWGTWVQKTPMAAQPGSQCVPISVSQALVLSTLKHPAQAVQRAAPLNAHCCASCWVRAVTFFPRLSCLCTLLSDKRLVLLRIHGLRLAISLGAPEQHDVRLRAVNGIVHPASGLLNT